MKIALISLCLLALATAPQVAVASDWKQIASTDNYEILVETASVQSQGTKAKAWVKLLYNRPLAVDGQSKKQYALSAISLTAFDCAGRAYLNLQTTTYEDKESKVVIADRKFTDFRADYDNVRPDSVGEDLFNFVCSTAKAMPARADSSPIQTTSSAAGSGSFSLVHWVIALLAVANIGAIVHIAVSPIDGRWKKAAWVTSSLLIPFIPYATWLVLRRLKPK